jgi:hypothetical protein
MVRNGLYAGRNRVSREWKRGGLLFWRALSRRAGAPWAGNVVAPRIRLTQEKAPGPLTKDVSAPWATGLFCTAKSGCATRGLAAYHPQQYSPANYRAAPIANSRGTAETVGIRLLCLFQHCRENVRRLGTLTGAGWSYGLMARRDPNGSRHGGAVSPLAIFPHQRETWRAERAAVGRRIRQVGGDARQRTWFARSRSGAAGGAGMSSMQEVFALLRLPR